MKVTDYISQRSGTLFSFEILPPLKGKSVSYIYQSIDPLLEFKPCFIDVTYHREEFVYKKHPNGLLEKISVRKRPGTVGICAAIQHKYGIDAVPHLICGGFSTEETENALIDLHFLGINNLLVLRGDSMNTEKRFEPEPGGHAYALDLLCQVGNLNKGIYLDQDNPEQSPTDFCIGVAGYPEKHFESPNLASDLKYLKMKIDAGADYIVTQMFFDNQHYFRFVQACREAGINVPIIPGIKPLATRSQLTLLPSVFHVEIPQQLTEMVDSAKSDSHIRQIGIEWATQQCKELIAADVPCIHFYTMGKSEATFSIAKHVF